MKSTPKWLLLPPALAALLILGTVSMQSGTPNAPARPQPATAPAEPPAVPQATADAGSNRREAPVLPRAPDLWQMASALAGVLLLGVGGVMLLRRLRHGGRGPRGANLVTLRQTLRLSSRQAIHAIEFDDRILLVGEHERGLSLLESGKLPERAADEAEVLARSLATAATVDDDDGAVPKNLVIPRPATPPARRTPTPPSTGRPKSSTPLGDFRQLLQKAGRA